MKILIVDDAQYIRERALQFLKDFKHLTIFEAASADEAIETFQNENIDLLIVDSVMPEKSGLEVVKTVKSINENTIIIGLTTQVKGATRKKLLEAGAKDILKKPFTKESFLLVLKEYI